MKKVKILLLFLITIFSLASCGKKNDETEEVVESKVVGIEITQTPSVTNYTEGDRLDINGLIVSSVYDDNSREIILDYTLDKTVLEKDDSKVSISWNGYTTSFNINVAEKPIVPTITGVEVRKVDGATWKRGDSFSSLVEYRTVMNTGEEQTWGPITNADVKDYSINGSKLTLNCEFTYSVGTFTGSVEIDVTEYSDVISVSEFYNHITDGNTYNVECYVLGYSTTMRSNEASDLLVVDKNTLEVLTVRNFCPGVPKDAQNYAFETYGIERGDELVLPLVGATAASNYGSEAGKTYANYQGGDLKETLVISKGNTFNISTEDAFLIQTEEQLEEFFTAPERSDNYFKIVHIASEVYTYSYSNRFWRIFYNNEATTNKETYVDGISVVFLTCNQKYMTGETFEEMIWGEDTSWEAYTSVDNMTTINKDIYAMYIGGNIYYHMLVILDSSWVKDFEHVELGKEFSAPTTLKYGTNGVLDLSGATITTYYDDKAPVVVDVTSDMLTSTPDFNTEGKQTITGSYEGFDFSFEITVTNVYPTSVEVYANPTKTTYSHRDNLSTVDLTGGKVKVIYSDSSYEIVDMSEDMKPTSDDNWKIGTVTYTMSVGTLTFDLDITYEVEALSVHDFILATDKTTNVELQAVVVAAVTTASRPLVILKDKVTGELLILDCVKMSNGYSAPKLLGCEKGDEIVITVNRALGVNVQDKNSVRAEGINASGETSTCSGGATKASIIVLSKDNDTSIDLSNATVVSNQTEFLAAVNNSTCVPQVIKFEAGLHACTKEANTATWTQIRVWYGDATQLSDVQINGKTPMIYSKSFVHTTIDFLTVFDKRSDSFTDPMTSVKAFYVLYIGGSGFYSFNVLDDSWIA